MKIRTGVDLVDVERLRRMIELEPDFVSRNWTEHEREQCGSRIDRFATRWAAKEAAMKALGIGIGEVSPSDIEVRSGESSQPSLVLHGPAAAAANDESLTDWSVSLSHEGSFAIAFVVAVDGAVR